MLSRHHQIGSNRRTYSWTTIWSIRMILFASILKYLESDIVIISYDRIYIFETLECKKEADIVQSLNSGEGLGALSPHVLLVDPLVVSICVLNCHKFRISPILGRTTDRPPFPPQLQHAQKLLATVRCLPWDNVFCDLNLLLSLHLLLGFLWLRVNSNLFQFLFQVDCLSKCLRYKVTTLHLGSLKGALKSSQHSGKNEKKEHKLSDLVFKPEKKRKIQLSGLLFSKKERKGHKLSDMAP